ncbi:type II secretion system F family protein [Stieleria marina]|uniref:Bacterial type II secretion system protein F domain protein n=1 Tax=Stieleria marina TaxID=1930275 RepID=A0A517NY49_9BACT|nr:Bacterial type II secretion system protein F domain protein [Planctomycetes bacterium K23_9]
MAQLSDLQLASLLDEVASAMRIDAPVVDAMRRLSERRLGRTARVAGKIAESLDRGVSTADAFRFSNAPLVAQAAAAVETCEASNDPSLLSQIAMQLRSRHEHSRQTRLTWLYPLFLVGLAYAVAVWVMAPMVRANQGRDFAWSDWVLRTSRYLEHSWAIPLCVGIVVVFLIVLWACRRNRLSTPARRLLFCQALADQLEHGVVEQDAIRQAASMAGLPNVANQPNLSLDSPIVRHWSAGSTIEMPEIDGASQQNAMVAQLRYASALHSETVRRNNYLWSTLFPRLSMTVVGGGLTLAYAWWVIRPIYQQVASW